MGRIRSQTAGASGDRSRAPFAGPGAAAPVDRSNVAPDLGRQTKVQLGRSLERLFQPVDGRDLPAPLGQLVADVERRLKGLKA